MYRDFLLEGFHFLANFPKYLKKLINCSLLDVYQTFSWGPVIIETYHTILPFSQKGHRGSDSTRPSTFRIHLSP